MHPNPGPYLGIALCVALLAGMPPVGGVDRTSARVVGIDEDRYERHDPISIQGDQDLMLGPPVGDDDGVREGSGTEDDPYIIARWRIPFDPGENPAIHVLGTSAHLVIEEIVFVPDDPSISGLNVWIHSSSNVTVRNLELAGAKADGADNVPEVLDMADVQNGRLDSVDLSGNGSIGFDASEVVAEEVTIDAWSGRVSMGTGTYTLRDIRVTTATHPHSRRGYAGGVIDLQRAGMDQDGPCRASVRNLTVRGSWGGGAGVRGEGCHLTLEDADIEAKEFGVQIRADASAQVRATRLQAIDQDPFEGEAGILLGDARDVEIEDVTAVGYPEGLTAEGSNFTVRRTGLVSETGGVVVEGSCSQCAIHNSSLWSVRNSGASTVDARWNWWGSASGPDDGAIEGSVLVEPLLSEPPDGVASLPEDGPGLPVPAWGGILAFAVAAVAWTRRPR